MSSAKSCYKHHMKAAWAALELEEAKSSPSSEGLEDLLARLESLKRFIPTVSWAIDELADFEECVEELYS